jgi:hypothetical protein
MQGTDYNNRSWNLNVATMEMRKRWSERHIRSRNWVSWAPVAHAYNPSYSGGRDQKDRSLKSARVNSLQTPISKISNTKKGWLNGSRVPTQQA